jgi:hypothetical protein
MLKTKVRRLAEDLSRHGFEHSGAYLIKRSRPNLDQLLELQPGHNSLVGKFTCNLAWRFRYPEMPGNDNAFHYFNRITDWLSHEPKEALEGSYERLTRAIEVYALPLLDSLDSVERILGKYEDAVANPSEMLPSADSPLLFFGRDEGWKHCHLGFTYKHLGNIEKAQYHLKLIVEHHSNYPYNWVAERKHGCEKALAAIKSVSPEPPST